MQNKNFKNKQKFTKQIEWNKKEYDSGNSYIKHFIRKQCNAVKRHLFKSEKVNWSPNPN